MREASGSPAWLVWMHISILAFSMGSLLGVCCGSSPAHGHIFPLLSYASGPLWQQLSQFHIAENCFSWNVLPVDFCANSKLGLFVCTLHPLSPTMASPEFPPSPISIAAVGVLATTVICCLQSPGVLLLTTNPCSDWWYCN